MLAHGDRVRVPHTQRLGGYSISDLTIQERVASLETDHRHFRSELAEINKHLGELVTSIGDLNKFKWQMVGAFTLANILGVGAVVKLLVK